MWKWLSLFLRNNYLLRSWGCLSLLNWIRALTLSLLLKLSPRKLKPWFVQWSFFLLRLLYISINLPYIHPCMEYCSHVLVLQLLPSLSPEPLAHRLNIASLSLSYRYYFGRCSSELAQLVSLPYSQRRSTCYSDRFRDFSVTIPRCYKNVYVNSFFPNISRLWNSLPIECFPVNYDLKTLKSRINKHLLFVVFF